MKLEFSRHIFEKYSNINFHENPFIGTHVVFLRSNGRTDMTKLTVASRNLTKAPTTGTLPPQCGRALHVMFTPDSDYLSKPNKPAGRGNGDAVCFKKCTNRIL